MRDVPELVDGYRRFQGGRLAEDAGRYRTLAEHGQSPKAMVIACCDSRVDPEAIFAVGPGELFVVRNVANLVPPYEPEGHYHGTDAALEFAVNGLEVETILVMGHSRCGGVKAFLDGLHEQSHHPGFIGRWVSLLGPAGAAALEGAADMPPAAKQRALELASVRQSITNLGSFPFIKDRVAAGRLRLRGAFFDVADGRLLALDPADGTFAPVA